MGMTSMFRYGYDLSGLLNNPMELKVSDVIHKATIEINEENTEATGATGELDLFYNSILIAQIDTGAMF